jgi:hypothetical protein
MSLHLPCHPTVRSVATSHTMRPTSMQSRHRGAAAQCPPSGKASRRRPIHRPALARGRLHPRRANYPRRTLADPPQRRAQASLRRRRSHVSSVKARAGRSMSSCRPRLSWNASRASSSSSVGSRKSVPSTRFRVLGKCWITATVANERRVPGRGEPSPDQPKRGPEVCRASVCGTLCSTRGWSNPSRFSRIRGSSPRSAGNFGGWGLP